MNCRDVSVRLDRFLDGELEMNENVEVVRHLEGCGGCASTVEGERLLFAEIRRQAAGPPAPAGLRERIAVGLARTRSAARPWPFARALVPATAAAILVGLFVLVFAPASLGPEAFAQRAVSWHEHPLATAAAVSGAPEIASIYSGRGQKSCMHEKTVCSGMEYGYKSACVENAGPAGTVTCWWTAACPKSGTRLSHARFPLPSGSERLLVENPRRRIPVGSRVVFMHYQSGFV